MLLEYPHQPYNGNPHASGRVDAGAHHRAGAWQHPFHEHGNHVRILARDGNLISARTIQQSRRTSVVHHDHNSGSGDDGIYY
jgi:hypothetical protein